VVRPSQRPLPELGSRIPEIPTDASFSYTNNFLSEKYFLKILAFLKNNRNFVEPAIQLGYVWIFNLPLKGRVITWGTCLFGCSLSFMLYINKRINTKMSHDLSWNNNLVSISVHNLTLKDQRQKQKDWRLLADFTNMPIPLIIHAETFQDIIITILPPKQPKTHTLSLHSY
jgi:hypothetical protein